MKHISLLLALCLLVCCVACSAEETPPASDNVTTVVTVATTITTTEATTEATSEATTTEATVVPATTKPTSGAPTSLPTADRNGLVKSNIWKDDFCYDLYVSNQGEKTAVITGYRGNETERLEFPSAIDGATVVAIECGAMRDKVKAKVVVIPDTVKRAGYCRFADTTDIYCSVNDTNLFFVGAWGAEEMEYRVTYHVKADSLAARAMTYDYATGPQSYGYFCQGETALWEYGKVGVFDPVEHGGFADYTPWIISFE